jgi:succinate-semialdehyde dehydrogenase/glutarate-semialdehyde dehydrogenase
MADGKGGMTVDVSAAFARAKSAQSGWAGLPWCERGRLLRKLAARARSDDELARTISTETGKPLFEAIGFEIAYVCEVTRFLSGSAGRRALAESRRGSLIFPHKRARVTWQPHGVVAVIGPWNFPLLNNFGDAVAPLLAGNSVLLKPSPHTPRTSRRMEALWRESGLPEGVFQVVEGDSEIGSALVDACDMVFFTGSLAAGRQVAARAGERLIPCVAELGGKSAMIVLADADLYAAARAAVWGAFAGAGQVCIRVERALVAEPVAEEFVRRVAEETAKLRLGTSGDVDVGPVMLQEQVERCERLVADAVARGARVVAGGERRQDLSGLFFSPTVLDGVSPEAAVACEETFGPILPILRVADAEQAIRLTNASHLGLSGSVWSRDRAGALAVARRLETGSICVNDVLVNYFFVGAPLGGVKNSGLGFRHGAEALRQFCTPRTIVEDRPMFGPIAKWLRGQLGFPYRRRVLEILRWLLKAVYR